MGDRHRRYLPRLLTDGVRRALQVFPVVVVTGARQTGKTTLVQHLGGERRYLSLDDIDILEQASSGPDDLLSRGDVLTLDEVQRAPDLLLAIKRAVDRDRSPGRFLLTGSANLLLSQRIGETLAGRAAYLTLWPLTGGEQAGQARCGRWTELLETRPQEWAKAFDHRPSPRAWAPEAARGGYPTPAATLKAAEQRALWFSGYTQTYLERDLRDLARVEALIEFRRLMRAASLRIGSLLNQTELARDTGIPRSTVGRYLDLLEISFQVVRLEPYSVNRTKRLIKSPKLYWTDTGLALHLGDQAEATGAHFENLVLCDLLAWRDSDPARPVVLYWRTAVGEEVDFVLERRGRLLAVEVKVGARPTHKDVRHLKTFLDEYGEAAHGGLLLHTGKQTEWLAERVLAVPWWRVF